MSEHIVPKLCRRCNTIKNPNQFHRSKRYKSGLQSYCKACKSSHAKNRNRLIRLKAWEPKIQKRKERVISGNGKYWLKRVPEHPRANRGYVFEHILIADKVVGKHLPLKAEVHHINGDGLDNRHSNLIICEDRAYHRLLHKRQKAYEETGNPNAFFCAYCKEWATELTPEWSFNNPTNGWAKQFYHRKCNQAQSKRHRRKNQ